MSIIYDALTKTQKNRDSATTKPLFKFANIKHLFSWFRVSMLILFSILTFAGVTGYPYLKHYFTKPKPKPIPVVQHISMLVNGVFVSGEDKMAMINKQLFHLGDSIDGMKIIEIELNGVKLQDKDHVVTLPVAS